MTSEKSAWMDYLRAVRKAPPESYEEVETWAWARLQVMLRRIKGKKEKVPA